MRALVPVTALLIALTGCGGDVQEGPGADEPPSVSTPTESRSPEAKGSTTPAPTATPEPTRLDARAAGRAFESWLDAMAAGDGGRACAVQTGRFTRSQLELSVERELVEPGASCEAVVAAAGRYYEALGIDLASAEVIRAQSPGDRVAFAVVLEGYPPIGFSLVLTDDGWRIDEYRTA